MNHGIYTALTGSLANERRLAVLTNNLANLNASGYKRDLPLFSTVLAGQGAAAGASVGVREQVAAAVPDVVWTDFSAGSLRVTGNPLDLAIESDAFFAVRGAAGQVYYTRNGSFRLNGNKELVTVNGDLVLSRQNPPRPLVVDGEDVKVSRFGEVIVDGQPVGSLRLVRFADRQGLQKLGGLGFLPTPAAGPPQPVNEPVVAAGVLEGANVDALRAMVSLIEISREYEQQQKVISTIGDLNQMAASEIAAV
ncbi:MAG: flagellar hook-basal body protein [Deltaproteobacteria bacterium]|jgi:flagellar basal-body rod protein FlgG|nr:flagellar hook-basal body protein [Deltaproteobacteria bacterium]